MRHIMPASNKWWRDRHDGNDPPGRGVDVHTLTIVAKLPRGALAVLSLVAPVKGDPLVPVACGWLDPDHHRTCVVCC